MIYILFCLILSIDSSQLFVVVAVFQLAHNSRSVEASSTSVCEEDPHAVGFWRAVLIPVSFLCLWFVLSTVRHIFIHMINNYCFLLLLLSLLLQGVIEYSLCLFFAKLVSYTFLFWLPFYIENTSRYL